MKAILFVLVFFVASPALGQGFTQGSFNPNAFGGATSAAKAPKKFLPMRSAATAGKLKISIASVAVGSARAGQVDRLLVTFTVKNTDTKKRIQIGSQRPSAADENANTYSADVLDVPNQVDAAEEVKFLAAVQIPAKKAKAIRLVLADGLGWEVKRADWEKTK